MGLPLQFSGDLTAAQRRHINTVAQLYVYVDSRPQPSQAVASHRDAGAGHGLLGDLKLVPDSLAAAPFALRTPGHAINFVSVPKQRCLRATVGSAKAVAAAA